MLRIFFEYRGIVIQLPVNPEELNINKDSDNQEESIIRQGFINRIVNPKLIELEIESFFPANPDGSYVLTKGKFKEPQFYIDFFEKTRIEKNPMRMIISDTKINMMVSIESFEWGYEGGDSDIKYRLKLKEYKEYGTRTIKIQQKSDTKVVSKPVVRAKTGFAIGDVVVVNGNYWHTSYGENPHYVMNNFVGKISHIVADTSRPYRYHITKLDGGYKGWVASSQIKHR